MRLPQDHDPLSIGDALFLHLERDGMPLNVALVTVLEGVIDLPSFVAYVESKLPLIPRYLQRVVTPPFIAGLPVWEYDHSFDIRNHVREVDLPHGTEQELKNAAAAILSTSMRRDRPLWDLTLVRGLLHRRTGVVARVHHCLADGISGVGLLRVLMEDAPQAFSAPKRAPRLLFPPPRDPAAALVDAVVNTCFTTVERVLSMESELLEVARHFATQNGMQAANADLPHNGNGNGIHASLEEFRRALPELLSPAQRLPFNAVCRGPQKFEWTSIDFERLRALKRHDGSTTNDVVLALLALSIQRYARLHRVPLRGRKLRIIVPVSVRGRHSPAELGNRITFVPVSIPLGVTSARTLLAAIHAKTSLLKTTHLAAIVASAGGLLTSVPTGVQALLGPIVSQLPLSVCNLICTNVPGPRTPLYLLGHKLLSCYPYVPIGGEMGMNCAVISYNGEMFFGFTGDTGAIPDLHLLPQLLQKSFREFEKEAGVRRRRRATSTSYAAKPEPDAASKAEIRTAEPSKTENEVPIAVAASA